MSQLPAGGTSALVTSMPIVRSTPSALPALALLAVDAPATPWDATKVPDVIVAAGTAFASVPGSSTKVGPSVSRCVGETCPVEGSSAWAACAPPIPPSDPVVSDEPVLGDPVLDEPVLDEPG